MPSDMSAKCELCGEPMPPGEEMFKFHGYSGPCPKPPLAKVKTLAEQVGDLEARLKKAENLAGSILATVKLNWQRGTIGPIVVEDNGGREKIIREMESLIESWMRQLNELSLS